MENESFISLISFFFSAFLSPKKHIFYVGTMPAVITPTVDIKEGVESPF